jgi:hypothetical protein
MCEEAVEACYKALTDSTKLLKFQASAANQLSTALFWVITQRVVAISYRRFGTTYRSHLQGSRIQKKKKGVQKILLDS